MCVRLFSLALLLAASAVTAGEITTIDGETIKCDIVAVTAKEVTYSVGNKEDKKPISKIIKIDYRDPEKLPDDKNFSIVELTDGTSLNVGEWKLKGKTLEMKLLSGPEVKLPTELVGSILNNGKEEKYRNDFRNRVINIRGKEALVIKRFVTRKDKESGKEVIVKGEDGKPLEVINNLTGTLSDGDEKGETIEVVVDFEDLKPEERKVVRKQSEIHGVIFKHRLPVKAPQVACRLLDTKQNVVMVSSVKERKGGGVIIETPAGAQMEFKAEQIAQLDYTRGRLDYLSAMLPAKTTITPNAFESGKDKVDKLYIFKDNSLNMTPIKVGGTSYRQGLTLLPGVELEYELGGQYRDFSAVIGIDDETNAEGEGKLEILADNKVIETVDIVYRTEKGKGGEPTKPARPVKKVNLNLKGVENLTIRFTPKDDLNGLSLSVSLGDAKVNK